MNGVSIVVAVRAQMLADALTAVIETRFGYGIDDAIFQAQRLRSACEKALGTRGRSYDG
jgi:hypothetical protein